jgi:DNA polymerase II small subunit/DNA polymerase delta subunit B
LVKVNFEKLLLKYLLKMKGPGVLLSEPMASTERCEVKNTRANHSDYKNLSDNFTLSPDQRSYQRQFYHIYNARLNAMRSKVLS